MDTRAVQKLKFSIKDFFSDCKPLHRIRSFFWTVFFRIRTEYEEIVRITLYSVRMQENTDQKNSEYGHFSRSEQIRRRLWIRSHLPKKLLAKNFIFLWNVHEGCSLYLLLFVHKWRYADQKTVFIHQYFIQRNYYEWVWFWKDYWLEFSWHSINLLLFLDQQDIFIFIRIIIYDLQT